MRIRDEFELGLEVADVGDCWRSDFWRNEKKISVSNETRKIFGKNYGEKTILSQGFAHFFNRYPCECLYLREWKEHTRKVESGGKNFQCTKNVHEYEIARQRIQTPGFIRWECSSWLTQPSRLSLRRFFRSYMCGARSTEKMREAKIVSAVTSFFLVLCWASGICELPRISSTKIQRCIVQSRHHDNAMPRAAKRDIWDLLRQSKSDDASSLVPCRICENKKKSFPECSLNIRIIFQFISPIESRNRSGKERRREKIYTRQGRRIVRCVALSDNRRVKRILRSFWWCWSWRAKDATREASYKNERQRRMARRERNSWSAKEMEKKRERTEVALKV